MFIPDPGSWFLPIPDPRTATKKRGEKKLVVIPFYLATNFTKLNIILVLKSWRKKCWSIFKELYNFLPKKLSLSSLTYGFGIRDPGSEIQDPEKTYSGSRIPDPGVKKAPDPGSGSATLKQNLNFFVEVSIRILNRGSWYLDYCLQCFDWYTVCNYTDYLYRRGEE